MNSGNSVNRPNTRLRASEYALRPEILARALLGCTLVRVDDDGTRLAGRIVETEAYCGPEDQASHARNGHRSPRNESMYGPPGLAYVYFTYGMHHCMNVVCGGPGEPLAVLIRALEPVEGLERMMRNRTGGKRRKSSLGERDLCSGPGRLCQALGVGRELDGLDLVTDHRMWIEPRLREPPETVNTPRVGVERAGDWALAPLRWFLPGCAHVSAPRAARSDLPRSAHNRGGKSGPGAQDS
jgi:DNA-3-methyladenine glycosylase